MSCPQFQTGLLFDALHRADWKVFFRVRRRHDIGRTRMLEMVASRCTNMLQPAFSSSRMICLLFVCITIHTGQTLLILMIVSPILVNFFSVRFRLRQLRAFLHLAKLTFYLVKSLVLHVYRQ